MLENFKQELQALLGKYPDVESISFKVTETVTRGTVSYPGAIMTPAIGNPIGNGILSVSSSLTAKKTEVDMVSPLEKTITPAMLEKIKKSSSLE